VTKLQELSRGRAETNHLPDGPAQRARDASLANEDPLAHNGWIYGHDAGLEPAAETLAGG
jgi:salicylate hydroxylase